MATKKPNALEFCRAYLRRSPKASFAQIRDAAKKKRITLWPISYGRALSLEGLAKTKPKKKAGKKRGRPLGSKNKVKRGPGRPKGSKNKAKGGVDLSGLDGLVASLKSLQRERDDALKTLDRIRQLIT
jgi:hypothetical protein